jgi:hypothetical protein
MAQAIIDSQIKPNYSPPQKCPNGCARWKNLADDGNTQNQYQVDAVWLNGYIPDEAGNQCAQPIGLPELTSPWCYCKGTNDGSFGYCEEKPAAPTPQPQQQFTTNQNDRDLKASVCKSTPNGLNDLNGEISTCTSTTEQKRNTNFAANTFKLQQDISALTATTMDSLTMGDTMFGQFGYNDIAKQVQGRNRELKNKKEKLSKEVEKDEATIERSNRDFEDTYKTIPEPQPKKVLRFIEDWTLAILSISYLFMIIAIIYIYTSTSELKFIAFGKSLVGSILVSMFLFMVLFYLT